MRELNIGRKLRTGCLLSFLAACGPSSAHAPEDASRPPTPGASSSSGGEGLRAEAATGDAEASVGALHRAPSSPRAANAPAEAQATNGARPTKSVGIRGITGSLTAFEVQEAMNKREQELLACVAKRPSSLGHVAGDIAFHIEVAGDGAVERVLVTESDIGYTPLEECLVEVVKGAPLPKPAGAERAEAKWRMSVDPLRRPAEPIDQAELEETIARQSAATYEGCDIKRARRFVVNGYLGRGRKLHPVSIREAGRAAAHTQEDAAEELTCLAEALKAWKHWPKGRGYAKVGFELRWVAEPPASRGKKRAAKRSPKARKKR